MGLGCSPFYSRVGAIFCISHTKSILTHTVPWCKGGIKAYTLLRISQLAVKVKPLWNITRCHLNSREWAWLMCMTVYKSIRTENRSAEWSSTPHIWPQALYMMKCNAQSCIQYYLVVSRVNGFKWRNSLCSQWGKKISQFNSMSHFANWIKELSFLGNVFPCAVLPRVCPTL